MPETVQLAVVRLASMVAWIGEHPGVGVDELGAHFHRTRRQVRRDIEYLASVGDSLPGASFEIDWELFETEQRISLRSTMGASAPLRFSEPEAQALLIGLSAIAPLVGPELIGHLPHAALVISSLGGLGETASGESVEASRARASSDVIVQLRDALTREQRVEFDYVSTGGKSSHRVVDPWFLEATATGWLLRGWCADAGAPRSFAASSMGNIRAVGRRVQVPRKMREESSTWMLDVDRDARWIADEYGGSINAELDDGGARIVLPVWNEQWGLSLLIDIAHHLRAAYPDMRVEAAQRAHRILSVWMREEPS